jgi:hypothetical protein
MTGAQYPVPDAALALDLSAVAQAAASGLLFVDAGRPAGPVGRMARVFAPDQRAATTRAIAGPLAEG